MQRLAVLPYGAAVVAVAAAVALRILLEPFIGDYPSFILSVSAVVMLHSAWIIWLTTESGVPSKLESEQLEGTDLGDAAINRRKDDFLAVLSHELRNPLAPIRNALEILFLNDLRYPEQIEARNVIDRQVRQLSAIVDDLLDVYGVTHQAIALRKETLNLSEIVKLAVEDHRTAFENSCLVLTLDLPPEPVWVLADRTRLIQVVSNLLNNAARFTNTRDRVNVRVRPDIPSQRGAVTVEDTGVGIAPALLPHVFDVFAQADQGIDRRRGGLGLGMGLVKGLVELHGGGVKARSQGLGCGSQISFWLPLAKKPKDILRAPLPVVQSPRRLRILIVEDNRDSAKTLQLLLARYGHEVAMSHSGAEGLQTAQTWHPEVVLCDIGLPEMDGYEVASALRRNPETAATRLIAVSGYDRDEDRHRSEEAGFDLHLNKPVDPVELQRLLSVLKVGP
jgi:signal transduction histidine kinase